MNDKNFDLKEYLENKNYTALVDYASRLEDEIQQLKKEKIKYIYVRNDFNSKFVNPVQSIQSLLSEIYFKINDIATTIDAYTSRLSSDNPLHIDTGLGLYDTAMFHFWSFVASYMTMYNLKEITLILPINASATQSSKFYYTLSDCYELSSKHLSLAFDEFAEKE